MANSVQSNGVSFAKLDFSNHGTEPIRDLKLTGSPRLELGNQEAILQNVGKLLLILWAGRESWYVSAIYGLKLACYMHTGRASGDGFPGQ